MTDTLIVLARAGKPIPTGPLGAVSAGDPFASGRQVAFRGTDGHCAGVARTSGTISITSLPHAECFIPVTGSLTIDDQSFGAGTAFVLPRGFSGKMIASADACWLFATETTAEAQTGDTALIVLDPTQPRNPSPGPAPEVVIGTPPQCHSLNLFTDTTSVLPAMRAGVWDVSTPSARKVVPHRVHEVMTFLEGEVTLTDPAGNAQVFHAGDAVFIPRGAPYAWSNPVKVVKFYTVK